MVFTLTLFIVTLSYMSGYWCATAGIDSVDAGLATRQIDFLVLLFDALMTADSPAS